MATAEGDADWSLPSPADHEDNGFLALPSSPAASSSGFAEDFYRSGTEWSSLRAPPPLRPPGGPPGVKEKERGGGSLVQSSLFQAWGIDKPRREAGDSSLVQRSLFQAWGIERPWTEGLGAGDSSPSPLPFRFLVGKEAEARRNRGGGGGGQEAPHVPLLQEDSRYICPLELDTEYVIEGVTVTLLEANHCPGAALIHFRLSDGKTYLHTGDFRASKSMQLHPLLQRGWVNLVYLDTTYCNPKYKFPPQEDVIDFVVRTARRYLKKQPKTLIVVGAYSIGKENVYLAISHDLENLKMYMETLNGRFLAVLAFRPTGWTFSEATGKQLDLIKPSSNGSVTIYEIDNCSCSLSKERCAYSEHSSFTELRDFAMFLRPHKVIPTVNVGNPTSRDKMQANFREWLKSQR
ncbi:unnamed protein product [Miscanthus lutarioriparius]|uniref:DNA repair metallo-beta-lactamase domain-containing protein n=1 Tax=Miscanthus lutarioriparius TaxID=422564 RepID=A0A811QPM7_9POAL|nr:unnamed protein product [Miscanthus lutarioriparius]